MSQIGERIRERRQVLNLSQLDLAYAVETSPNQISRYERGENDPTASMLIKIAKVLNASTDYLLGLVETPEARYEGGDEVVQKLLEAYMAGALEDVIEIVLMEMKERRKNEKPKSSRLLPSVP